MNKKFLALVFALIMIISLVGCKGNTETTTETNVTEPVATEEPAPQKPVVDTLGWKLNPTEMNAEQLADVVSVFAENYEGMMLKPVACIAVNEAEAVSYRFLCRSEEAFVVEEEVVPEEEEVTEEVTDEAANETTEVVENETTTDTVEKAETEDIEPEEFVAKLYVVTVTANADGAKIAEVSDFNLTALMEMAEDAAKAETAKFTEAGWKTYLEQTAMEMPTAVEKALTAVSADGETIQFVAVHGAEDGTLTFAVLFRNATEESAELNMMFIAVPADGNAEIINTVTVI